MAHKSARLTVDLGQLGLPTEARGASEGWSGRRGSNPRPTAWKAVTLPLSYSRLRPRTPYASLGLRRASPLPSSHPQRFARTAAASPPSPETHSPGRDNDPGLPAVARGKSLPAASEGWWAGEDSNLRSPGAADLQSAAIDRSATCPKGTPPRRIRAVGTPPRSGRWQSDTAPDV
jgi:hypothetical protein